MTEVTSTTNLSTLIPLPNQTVPLAMLSEPVVMARRKDQGAPINKQLMQIQDILLLPRDTGLLVITNTVLYIKSCLALKVFFSPMGQKLLFSTLNQLVALPGETPLFFPQGGESPGAVECLNITKQLTHINKLCKISEY